MQLFSINLVYKEYENLLVVKDTKYFGLKKTNI